MHDPVRNRLEYEDLLTTPDDGNRYELLDGEVAVTPSPSPAHQRALLNLTLQLVEYFHGGGLGEVFVAPLDVILTRHDVVEPDIVVVSDPTQVSERGIEGPPMLVVEVLSPSTREHDRTVKAQRYARLGIAHYWIVDPGEKRIECLQARNGVFELVVAHRDDDVLIHPAWDRLRVRLRDLWG